VYLDCGKKKLVQLLDRLGHCTCNGEDQKGDVGDEEERLEPDQVAELGEDEDKGCGVSLAAEAWLRKTIPL
jgi:hypothetical protein